VLTCIAILKHINRIYTNRSSWLLAPSKLDWSKQIVLITGGKSFLELTMTHTDDSGGSGIGALLAQTLAMRNVTTVVLSKDPVLVDPSNGELLHDASNAYADNSDDIVDSMFTYTCDVSNYKEVEEVAERIRKEVSLQFLMLIRC
jgi:all-trans-retinol dehydrogenase (NAD+)